MNIEIILGELVKHVALKFKLDMMQAIEVVSLSKVANELIHHEKKELKSIDVLTKELDKEISLAL